MDEARGWGGPADGHRVIGVVGCNGGVGASTFAAALASTGGGLLVDLDVGGGGVDVLLGIDGDPGARWSSVQVAGGELDPDALTTGVPAWRGCGVLAADVHEIAPDAVLQVVSAARAAGPVVIDLPRSPCPERAAGLQSVDLVVLVARADIVGLAAAHAVAIGLPALPCGLVVRRGSISPTVVSGTLGMTLLGRLPAAGVRSVELRVPRATLAVAQGVLDGIGA